MKIMLLSLFVFTGCSGFERGVEEGRQGGRGLPGYTQPVDYLGWVIGLIVGAAGGAGGLHLARNGKHKEKLP